MKVIRLKELPGLKTTDIIRAVIERPANGCGLTELRDRCRILDALDKSPPDATALDLEDADHETLVRALNTFQFGMATRDLLSILDDILNGGASAGNR